MIVLALLALLAAPVLAAWAERSSAVAPILRGFVFVAVGALVLLHVLPHGVEAAGLFALVAVAAGALLPFLVERLERRAYAWTERLALVGVAIHEALDGAGLALSDAPGLGLAIIVHRVPVALFLWWMVSKRHGRPMAALLLTGLGALTVAGYLLGNHVVVPLGAAPVGFATAFLGGLLLHVLFSHHFAPAGPALPRLETLGGALAGGALLLAPEGLIVAEPAFGERFVGLAFETAPALLLGYLLAGVIGSFLPRATIAWAARGGDFGRSLRGVLVGLPIPICSCGVIPVYRGLAARGLPASAGFAFLVATPELGVESVLISWPLLGGPMTGARIVAAAVAAIAVGYWVGRSVPSVASARTEPLGPAPSLAEKTRAALGHGLGEVVEHTAPWILVGLVVAAAIDPEAWTPVLGALPAGLDVVVFALLGLPIYVCASGATPLAAAFLVAGASPGAALAFLISGPASNLTTVGVLTRMHGRNVAFAFAGALLGISVLLGLGLNALLPSVAAGLSLPGAEAPTLLQQVCLAALGAAFLAALLRRGPTRLARSLFEVDHGHEHDHPGHEHDHPGHEHDHRGHDHDHSGLDDHGLHLGHPDVGGGPLGPRP